MQKPAPVLALLAFLAGPLAAAPTDYFVRTSGSDANGGSSPADAWQTIVRAGTAVQAGDTVYVGAGTYIGSVRIQAAGTLASPIVLRADRSGFYTGDAGRAVIDANGATTGIQADGADHLVVEGFDLTGQVGTGAAIKVAPGSPAGVILRGNRFYANVRAILVNNTDATTLEGNVITTATGNQAVDVRSSTNVVVRGNLIYANLSVGVRLLDSVGLVEGNTLYLCQNSGLQVQGAGSNAILRHNLVTNGTSFGIELASGAATSSNNLVWNNGGGNWSGLPMGSGDLSANPLFVDPAGSDGILGRPAGLDDDRFQLQDGSPAIDAGSLDAAAVVFSDGNTAAYRTTRLDEVPDGFSVDGDVLNLGYHYEIGRDCDGDGFPDEVEVDSDGNGIPDDCEPACAPVFYCSGKTNSLGLVPFLTTSAGTPSLVAQNSTPFRITANDVIPNNIGFLLYGYSKGNLNYHGGKLCIKAPVLKSFPAKFGSAGGTMFRNFNSVLASGNDPMLTVGQVVTTQWRQSDPADPAGFGDTLTDGCRFKICP